MDRKKRKMKMILKSRKKTFWLLLALCCLTLLPFLGLSQYHTKGEPRESIVAYSMLATDNWTLPLNNGGEMAYKPPFFHWCVAAVSAIKGEVTEGTSRWPSALALIAMTVGGFLFYARRKGVLAGLLTAMVAWTTFELHRAGGNCRVDMVLTAATVGAFYSLYIWTERGKRCNIWLCVAIALMAIGTLTKGPVGTLIPCLVTGCYLLLRGKPFFRSFFLMVLIGLASLIPYAIWFYAAWQKGGQEFLDLMYEENIGRMTSTMGYESCVQPWYYNFFTVIAGFVPWTLLMVISLFFLRWRRLRLSPKSWRDTAVGWMRPDPVEMFTFTAIIVTFVFYCIPQSKRSVYLMPIYPFISYFIAKFIRWMGYHATGALRIYGSILSVLCLLLPVCLVALKMGAVPDSIFHGRHAADNVAMIHALAGIGTWWQWLLIAATTLIGLSWWWTYKEHHIGGNKHLAFSIIAITIGLYLSLDGVYTPTVLNTKSVRDVSAEIDLAAPASEGTLYEFMEAGMLAKGDPLHFFEVNFYLHNRIENFLKQKPAEGFLLISKTDAENYFGQFKKEGYHFNLRYETPKREMQVYAFDKDKQVQE